MAMCLYILRPNGIFYGPLLHFTYGHLLHFTHGHLVHFWTVGIFFPVFGYIVPRKIWQPWVGEHIFVGGGVGNY
jgi:hypothetical protein